MRVKKSPYLFAYSAWDIIPVLAGCLHFLFFAWMISSFHSLALWQKCVVGLIYAFSISWNVNSVSHNFIHNAYFKSTLLNRLFSLMESVTMGLSQTMYDYVHRQHHIGNNDRKGADGETIDWISIYRHGEHGQAEHPLKYSLLSYFRDDPKRIYGLIKKHSQALAYFAVFEVVVVTLMIVGFLLWDWQFGLFFVFFYYLGHSLTAMNGYYEHAGANPDLPIAWGVSCYNKLYNWLWLNNGYHAEHHYRPKHHWTQMHTLHTEIAEKQKQAGVKVIPWPHPIGFMMEWMKEQ